MSYTYEYPRPSVTTDAILICKNEEVSILLIQRKNEPFQHKWAFPGGFVDMDEDINASVLRELNEETGLSGIVLSQFATYGAVDRDPRQRTITVCYVGFVDECFKVSGYDDALDAKWFPLHNLPELAFDHSAILNDVKLKYNL